eukprot:2657999-Amphidinium_carterae.2
MQDPTLKTITIINFEMWIWGSGGKQAKHESNAGPTHLLEQVCSVYRPIGAKGRIHGKARGSHRAPHDKSVLPRAAWAAVAKFTTTTQYAEGHAQQTSTVMQNIEHTLAINVSPRPNTQMPRW